MSLKNSNALKKTHKFLLNKLKDKRTLKIYKKFGSKRRDDEHWGAKK